MSVASNAANSSGLPPPGSSPISARRLAFSGCFKMSATSRCNRLTIAGGVPAGANIACQELNSKPSRPVSCKVGNSGAALERLADVTAKPISFFAAMCRCQLNKRIFGGIGFEQGNQLGHAFDVQRGANHQHIRQRGQQGDGCEIFDGVIDLQNGLIKISDYARWCARTARWKPCE